jgi:hypothetical protein
MWGFLLCLFFLYKIFIEFMYTNYMNFGDILRVINYFVVVVGIPTFIIGCRIKFN